MQAKKGENSKFSTVLQEKYDLFVILETWWDELHDWSAAINGY